MRSEQFSVTVSQPYLALLKLEASNSGRTVEDHILHCMGRRYDNLLRACTCGYFLYAVTDDLRCSDCGKPCCPYCSTPLSEKDLCFRCCDRAGINREGKGGFRAAPEGKV